MKGVLYTPVCDLTDWISLIVSYLGIFLYWVNGYHFFACKSVSVQAQRSLSWAGQVLGSLLSGRQLVRESTDVSQSPLFWV